MQEGNRTEVGTEITLYLNEDSLAFANEYRAREVLEKYCSFMPVEISSPRPMQSRSMRQSMRQMFWIRMKW